MYTLILAYEVHDRPILCDSGSTKCHGINPVPNWSTGKMLDQTQYTILKFYIISAFLLLKEIQSYRNLANRKAGKYAHECYNIHGQLAGKQNEQLRLSRSPPAPLVIKIKGSDLKIIIIDCNKLINKPVNPIDQNNILYILSEVSFSLPFMDFFTPCMLRR